MIIASIKNYNAHLDECFKLDTFFYDNIELSQTAD